MCDSGWQTNENHEKLYEKVCVFTVYTSITALRDIRVVTSAYDTAMPLFNLYTCDSGCVWVDDLLNMWLCRRTKRPKRISVRSRHCWKTLNQKESISNRCLLLSLKATMSLLSPLDLKRYAHTYVLVYTHKLRLFRKKCWDENWISLSMHEDIKITCEYKNHKCQEKLFCSILFWDINVSVASDLTSPMARTKRVVMA